MSKLPLNITFNESDFVMIPTKGGSISFPLQCVLKLYRGLGVRISEGELELLVEDHQAYANDPDEDGEGFFVWVNIEELKPVPPLAVVKTTH